MGASTERADVARTRRVLFIHPGPVPPSSIPTRNAAHFLSAHLEGALLTTTWAESPEEVAATVEETRHALGRFRLHALPMGLHPRWKSIRTLAFYVRTGLQIHRREPYSAVVSYGIYTTGLAGIILSILTGAALVIDVPGHPFRAFEMLGRLKGRLKARAARWIAPLILARAQAIKLLYPAQLDDLKISSDVPRRVFHEFTAVSEGHASALDERYILLLGYPWYVKGVDLLIQAFLRIADRHPAHRLLVVGHCPDRAPFERIANGHPRIELRKAVPHNEVRELLARCTVLAVPSRTEAMGRVILEAYAAAKPVVASRVDGIPTIVQDGVTGLLCDPESVGDLASKLDTILSQPQLAATLARNGYAAVHARFNEEAYASEYSALITMATSRGTAMHPVSAGGRGQRVD